ADGIITTVAGTGRQGFSGDGGKATSARLSLPLGVAAASDGGFLIADLGSQRIRRVAPDGTITTVAGTGTRGFGGDGGAATSALLANPSGVAILPGGGFLISDTSNHRVRRVGPDGSISTVAGSGTAGFSGDGGSATSARLSSPAGVGVTRTGGILIADTD